jgi:hypothetical protein
MLQQFWGRHFGWSVWPSVRKQEIHGTQTFWYRKFAPPPGPHGALFQSLLPLPWLSLFVSVWWRIDFSFVSLGRDSSLATTMGLIGDVCGFFFKTLYPSSDTASESACVFTYTFNLCVNIWYWDFFLNKKFSHCTLPKGRDLSSQILVLKYDHVTGAGDNFHSGVRR